MKFLSIEYIKQHSRIEYDCEDELLELLGDAAERKICNDLRRGKKVDDMISSLKEEYGEIPADLYLAGFLLVDNHYRLRGATSQFEEKSNPFGYESCTKPYMKLAGNG